MSLSAPHRAVRRDAPSWLEGVGADVLRYASYLWPFCFRLGCAHHQT
jgi:hypothetical protein